MPPTMITHLLVTSRYVVKGVVRTGGQRMQAILGADGPNYLILENAILWELEGTKKVEVGNGLIRRDQVVFAHEYMDFASDPHRSQLEVDEERQPVALQLLEPRGWELQGNLRAVELSSSRDDGVLVLLEPSLDAPPIIGAAREARDALNGLPYIIVNRSFVHGFLGHE